MRTGIYEETSVITQDKGKIIVMLYDGAMKFLNQAMISLEKQDYASKGEYIVKAQDIIMELNSVLDMEVGGQISQSLRQLYIFMWKHLNEANIKRDARMIQKVIDLMRELNQGWRGISE